MGQRSKHNCEEILHAGYNFIENKMLAHFTEITPEMVRKVELLESILFGFIDHGNDFSLLDTMEHHIYKINEKVGLH